ncbi:hypothetical protein HDV01_003792 [Terramyces sp. JEL0728]|nr:hypothetical protein HDV01_003792 [Terramyces sp. JEL0728]
MRDVIYNLPLHRNISYMTNLKKLEITNRFSPINRKWIAEALPKTRITELHFPTSTFLDSMEEIIHVLPLTQIRKLVIGINVDDLRELAIVLPDTKIKELNLLGGFLTTGSIKYLTEAMVESKVEQFAMSNEAHWTPIFKKFDSLSLQYISLRCPPIYSLEEFSTISMSKISRVKMKLAKNEHYILHALFHSSIQELELHLSSNYTDFSALAKNIKQTELKSLKLDCYKLGYFGLQRIFAGISKSNLQELDIQSKCNVQTKSIFERYLCKSKLKKLCFGTTVGLGIFGNSIQSSGIVNLEIRMHIESRNIIHRLAPPKMYYKEFMNSLAGLRHLKIHGIPLKHQELIREHGFKYPQMVVELNHNDWRPRINWFRL